MMCNLKLNVCFGLIFIGGWDVFHIEYYILYSVIVFLKTEKFSVPVIIVYWSDYFMVKKKTDDDEFNLHTCKLNY